jgi:VRR-NUC domain
MRQLSLFKGKKQRGEKPPAPLEFESHCALADLIKRCIHPNWIGTHLPFGEHRNIITAVRLKRMGVRPGWPDFVFVGPGRIVFLELKRKGGRVSEEQRDVFDHLELCGFAVYVKDNVKDAIALLCDIGILRTKIEVP